IFDRALTTHPQSELLFSEGVGIILIVLYGLNLLYSFRNPSDDPAAAPHAEEHETAWSLPLTLGLLIGATIATALVSETLVGVVEEVTTSLGLTEFFLGIIIIPIVGNIAEHFVAVQVAMKNKMELSLAV